MQSVYKTAASCLFGIKVLHGKNLERYVHGDLDLSDMIDYLFSHIFLTKKPPIDPMRNL